jgi:hypothetical protein
MSPNYAGGRSNGSHSSALSEEFVRLSYIVQYQRIFLVWSQPLAAKYLGWPELPGWKSLTCLRRLTQ